LRSLEAGRDYVTFLEKLIGAEVQADGEEKYLQLTHMFGDTNTLKPVVHRGLVGKENRLVVRDFYDDMGNDMLHSISTQDIHRVYVTGTPGTGKSTYRNFLAWKILQKFKTAAQPVRIAMHKGGIDSFFLLCLEADGSLRAEKWKTFDIEVATSGFTLGHDFFGLSDVSKGDDKHTETFTQGSIIFSSPNDKAWQQGGKENCDFFCPCGRKKSYAYLTPQKDYSMIVLKSMEVLLVSFGVVKRVLQSIPSD